jgi:hypothetical protein
MTYFLIPLFMFAVIGGGCWYYIKFIHPKNSLKYGAAVGEADADWVQNKDAIVNEYFANPQKFKLFKDVIKNDPIVGFLSIETPTSLGKKVLSDVATAVTNVRVIDMKLYYLIATETDLHMTAFNGINSEIHEVFEYSSMTDVVTGKDKLSFTCNGNKFAYTFQDLVWGYPRFDVHEAAVRNNFYREYFALEPTVNAEAKGNNLSMMKQIASKEYQTDAKVREFWVAEFKRVMKSKFGVFN